MEEALHSMIMKDLQHVVIFTLVSMCLSSNLFAVEAFNLNEANHFFDKTSIALATQNIEEMAFRQAVESIESLQDEAKNCIEETNATLLKLEALQQSIPKPTSPNETVAHIEKDKKTPEYISQKKQSLIKRHADCQLFIYRSEEALVAYKETLKKLSTQQLFLFHKPIWGVLATVYNNQEGIPFNWLMASQKFGLNQFSNLSKLSILIYSLVLILISFYLRHILHAISLSKKKKKLINFSITLKAYILPLTLLLGFFFSRLIVGSSPPSALFYEVFGYTLTLLAILIALKWMVITHYQKKDNAKLLYQFKTRSKLLLFFAWLFIIVNLLLDNLFVNIEIMNMIMALGSIYFVLLYVVWLSAFARLLNFSKGIYKSLIILIEFLLLLIVILTSIFGYYHVAMFTITSTFKSTLCLVLFKKTWHELTVFYDKFNNKDFKIGKKIKHFLAQETDKSFIELLLLKLIIQMILLGLLVTSLISIWFVTINFMELIEETLYYPIKLGGFSFSLLRILIGTVVFTSILLMGRIVASVAVDSKKYKKNDDTQVILSSVIVYISFGLALILGLIVMGVDFTGLAIIAGALSVGVGLGLQNIVNNFVSGLILLIEQPIKPGDRVVIGTTEGIVKKIRIRSTQIKTMAKEDVIVPNADLIANQVTNYMYKDNHYRIICQVGVAYGSDTELVSKLLHKAALNHPDVIHKGMNAPKVLFRQFGDSCLVFELWSTIKEVNNKYVVQSQLNFAIDKSFREHKVVIAFPQMDLHIQTIQTIQTGNKN